MPLLAASVALAAPKDVPYHSWIGLDKASVNADDTGIDPEWTVIDVLDDATYASYTKYYANIWTYPAINESDYIKAGFQSAAGIVQTAVPDDWLISPAIHLETGKTYRLRMAALTAGSESATTSLTGVLSTTADLTSLATPVDTIFSREMNTGGTWHRTGDTFEVAETGDYYIALHCHEPKCSRIIISDFSVVIDSFVPAAPGNLVAVPGTEAEPRKLSVTLSWTNPLSDRDDKPFTDGKTVTSLQILRDNSPVTVLEGNSTSWTDTEVSGLKNGYHTYTVIPFVGDAEGEAASVLANYAGDLNPLPLPAFLPVTTLDDFDFLWKTQKGSRHTMTGSSNVWKHSINGTFGNRLMMMSQLSTDTKKYKEDCWAFTPAFDFSEAGEYEVILDATYYKSSKPTYDREVELLIGKGQELDESKTSWPGSRTICEKLPVEWTASQKGIRQSPIKLVITTPGAYNLGLHAKGTGNGCNYCIYGISIQRTGSPVGIITTTSRDNAARYSDGSISFPGKADIDIFTFDGKAVMHLRGAEEKADMNSLPKGCYIARISSTEYTISLKFIK